MSDRGPYRRRKKGWSPTAAQARVLDALAEGMTNAEIAVRLGISPETVKWHISELLALANAKDRLELVRWWQQPDQRRRSPSWLWLLIPSVAIATLAVFIIVGEGGKSQRIDDRTPDLPSRQIGAREGPTLTPWLSPTPLSEASLNACPPHFGSDSTTTQLGHQVDPSELAGQGLVPLGHLIDDAACPLFVVNRADRAFFRIPLSAKVDGYEIYGMAKYRTVKDRAVKLAGKELTLSFASAGGAYAGPGAEFHYTAIDENGRVYRMAADDTGGVWVDPTAVPDSAVLDEWTGEELDVSGMTKLARLQPDGRPLKYAQPVFYFTSCERDAGQEHVCEVSYRPFAPTIAPVSGTLRCFAADQPPKDAAGRATGEMELDAGDFKLRFKELYTSGGGPHPDVSCEARFVKAGEVIGTHYHYEITGFRPDGNQIAVVAALDSTLYVGDFADGLSCPCTYGD